MFDSSIPVQLAFYALVEHGESLKTSRSRSGRQSLNGTGGAGRSRLFLYDATVYGRRNIKPADIYIRVLS